MLIRDNIEKKQTEFDKIKVVDKRKAINVCAEFAVFIVNKIFLWNS